MKKKLIITLLSILTITIFILHKQKNKLDTALDMRSEISEHSTSVKIKHKKTEIENNSNVAELCTPMNIASNNSHKSLLEKHRADIAKNILALIKSNNLSEDAKSFIMQASGITHLEFIKFRANNKHNYSDLMAVDGKPSTLDVSIALPLLKKIPSINMDQVIKEVKKHNITHQTALGRESLVSNLLKNNKFTDTATVQHFFVNTKFEVNFSDIVNSIRYKQPLEIIQSLISFYSGRYDLEWNDNFLKNNLATYSAQYGRVDLLNLWLSVGVLPFITADDKFKGNTILDMAASYKLNRKIALEILEIAEKYKVSPIGYSSYLYFNTFNESIEHKYYLEKIYLNFMSSFNFTKLPADINTLMDEIVKSNKLILDLNVKITNCESQKNYYYSELKNKFRENTKEVYQSSSTDYNYQENQQFNFILSNLKLLHDKNYDEFLSVTKIKANELGQSILDLGITQAITENAPTNVIISLVNSGGRIQPGTIAVIALTENIELLSELIDEKIIEEIPHEDIVIIKQIGDNLNSDVHEKLIEIGYN
jgi:hypothetical protein